MSDTPSIYKSDNDNSGDFGLSVNDNSDLSASLHQTVQPNLKYKITDDYTKDMD